MDWYIDQMKRKAYESEPLPITLTQDKYRNGTRDVVFVQERTSQAANLKDILEFVSSDLAQAKVSSSSGEQFNFIPTRNFRIPVDTSVVLHNGTVMPRDREKIVPAIEWKFNRNSLGKSDLAVLDILAHNNWKRPVYYASLGHEGTLGLEDYMQLEGFAYRLVPIKSHTSNRYEAGRIEADLLYENLMNRFRYGNMNDPGVYLDDFHVRTMSIIRLRNRFIQLAGELINRGDTARALKALDRCVELTPDNKIPFDHTIIQIANYYYQCNQFEKANTLVNVLREKCDGKLSYFLDQKNSFVSINNDQIVYNLQILQNLAIISKNFNQTALSLKIDSITNNHYKDYSLKSRKK
jgi:hypothetical protein